MPNPQEKDHAAEKFEVWHANVLNVHADRARAARHPTGYTLVATVEAESRDAVFDRTNHTDQNWLRNPGVTPHVAEARSTSVGDVIVASDGAKAMYHEDGLSDLPSRPPSRRDAPDYGLSR